jgi:hypothetical protein
MIHAGRRCIGFAVETYKYDDVGADGGSVIYIEDFESMRWTTISPTRKNTTVQALTAGA